MKFPSKVLEDAVNAVSLLPGIGKKSALRLVLHLIQDENHSAEIIASSLKLIKTDIKHCQRCHMISDHDLCDICKTPARNIGVLCIVESVKDVMAIEETQQYNGLYHILGGVISPIDGIGPDELNIDSLIKRVEGEQVKELIMAISPTIDGETTIFYISKKLKGLDVNISTIARGVSFGGELEYADVMTLGRSISKRLPYELST